jgi:GDP-L-fucose synthase
MGYWTDRRVVVTGGGGFLGRHVVEKLQEAGCDSVFVVRRQQYDLTKEEAVLRLFSDLKQGRVGWRTSQKTAEPGVDVVIHLAGLVGGIGANKAYPADFFYRNLMMNTLVLHYAWQSGVRKVVVAGAGCGYPEHAPLPLREESFWDGFPQWESAPYSLAKRMLHVQSIAYWRQHHFPIIIGVPGNIYGPYDNFDLEMAHVVPALVRKFVDAADSRAAEVVVWGTGKASRDFVYAGDAAEGLVRAAERLDRAEIFNLSCGTGTSVREVVENLRTITGYTRTVRWDASRPDGQAARQFDVSKAKRLLGWEAVTPIMEGLQATVDWYRAHRAEARLSESIWRQ